MHVVVRAPDELAGAVDGMPRAKGRSTWALCPVCWITDIIQDLPVLQDCAVRRQCLVRRSWTPPRQRPHHSGGVHGTTPTPDSGNVAGPDPLPRPSPTTVPEGEDTHHSMTEPAHVAERVASTRAARGDPLGQTTAPAGPGSPVATPSTGPTAVPRGRQGRPASPWSGMNPAAAAWSPATPEHPHRTRCPRSYARQSGWD